MLWKPRSARRHAVRARRGAARPGLEALERRAMLAANVLDVTKVLWSGKQVDAVRNEYVLRMPQTNKATAKSPLDYACATPVVQAGWSVQSLGSGFFKLRAPNSTQTAITTWASRSGVMSIDVNRVAKASLTPNDPLYADASNWAFPRIVSDQAWETGTGTSSTIVAVLDSGVDYNHPDLAANMWRNPNEIPGDGRDNDNNGYIDDIFGINALTGTVDPMDDFGHGTFIAGLVGAVGNNAVGMTGVNWACKLMAVKVMDAAGNVPLNAEIVGINYVIRQKLAGQSVAVANCSFGRNAFDQQEFDALNQLALTGVTIVAAAGNDSNDNDVNPVYPANYAIDGLISVAASDQNDNLAPFSNFGATTVDLVAPGVGILSTRAAQATGPYPPYQGNNYTVSNNGFTQNQAFVDGTSASAALVSGAAALLKSLKPGASAVQIKNAILNGADRVAALNGVVLTSGRLNLQNAVNLVLATTGAVPDATFSIGQNLRYLEGNIGHAMAEVKVRLDRPVDPGKSCSVFYTTQPGGSAFANVDYVATSGFLTFSGSETEKSFFVRLIGDRLAEQAEQFAVQIVAARSRGVTTGGGALQQVNIVILDDDNTSAPVQPGPTNAGLLPQVSVDVKRDAAGVALPIYEGNTATFVVSLDKTSTKPVSVRYRTNQPSLVPVNTALEGVDYVATSGTLTFKPGERTKEFTVRILADKVWNEGIDLNGDGDVRDPGEGEEFRIVLTEPVNADLAPATEVGTGGGGTGGGGAATGLTTRNTSGAVTARIIDAVVPPPAPGFQITLNYLGNVPAALRGAAEWAAARWSQVITADLPDVIDPATGTVIDDILINVQSGLLDGPPTDGVGGTLANAGPEQFRTTGTRLPWLASAGIDPADAANPLLYQIVLHEFGHALGFVAELFTQKNLLTVPGSGGVGWVGANALREYRSIFGVRNALNVPMETAGGEGTAVSHWAESVFGNELMTGFVGNATTLPLSRVTVGAMADLGYTVNYARADAFTKPVATSTTVPRPSTTTAAPIRLAPAAVRRQFAALAAATGLGSQPASGTRAVAPGPVPVAGGGISAPARRAAFVRV